MSTCPEKIIISEYLDGTLPSPWKEKLQSHILECPTCEATYEAYKKISDSMKAQGSKELSTFDYDASFESLKQKLNQRLARQKLKDEARYDKKFWQKSVKLPVPALLAAALLLLFLPAFTFFASRSKTVTVQNYAYELMSPSPKLIRNTRSTLKQVNFNSGVSGFLRFYLPSDEEQGVYKVMDIPASIDIGQYINLFQDSTELRNIETIEKKSPKN